MVVEFKPLSVLILLLVVYLAGAVFVMLGKMDASVYWPAALTGVGSYIAGWVTKSPTVGGGA